MAAVRWMLLGLLLIPTWVSADVAIVDAAGRGAHLVLPDKPDAAEKLAATELVEHVEAITGVKLVVHSASAAPAEGVAIRLGDRGDAATVELLSRAGADGDAFALRASDDGMSILGRSSGGTLCGVYELLEQLGVRWYMPGELGRVLPETRTLTVRTQATVQTPSFAMRRASLGPAGRVWARRLRLGGDGPPTTLAMPTVGDFASFPERYALAAGRRDKGQLCISNPDTLREVVHRFGEYFAKHPKAGWFPMGNHGGGHCECDSCRKMDPPEACGPYTGGINVTDRYLLFIDRIFAALGDELPDKRIALSIATPHMCPPAHRKGHARLDVVAWPNAYCRIHGVNNPVCRERMQFLERITAWVHSLQGKFYERSDWGNVAGPGLLFPSVHRFRQGIPTYHAIGMGGVATSVYSHWASENPGDYIGAKLLWNCSADVDAMLDEFYRLYYGPAAEPMRAYHELVTSTMRDADRHAGTGIDIPHIFTAEVRTRARTLAETGAQLTPDGSLHARRIAAVIGVLDYTAAFCAMIEQRDRHDYAAAAASLDRAHAAIAALNADPKYPLLNPSFAGNYLNLFFGDIVRAAAARTVAPNNLVVGLDDIWLFRTDPQNVGVEQQWWKAPTADEGWKPIRAWTDNWSAIGLRYYQGHAWYRQTVTVPAAAAGQPVMLWIGAVDEKATIWINDVVVGETPSAAFKPFEFDVTQVIQPGKPNLVVIRTANLTLDEVGTGGLLAPVMLYRPGS